MTRGNDNKPNRLPTSADVARAAGVSRATVSFVLNKTPGQQISPATRSRILDAARRLGYRPNPTARALSRGHSDEIVFVIGDKLDPYTFKEWALAMEKRAAELGYTVGMYVRHESDSPRAWRAQLRGILARRPAGIIGSAISIGKAEYQIVQEMGVRACALYSVQPVHYCRALDMTTGAAAVELGRLLSEHGRTRVTTLLPRPSNPITQAAIAHDQRVIEECVGTHISPIEMEPTLASARGLVDVWVRSPDRPTAVFGPDENCFALLYALQERGLRVPDDIALIASRDSPLCEMTHPTLTALQIDLAGIGSRLVEITHAQLRGKEPSPSLYITPTSRLIRRESF